MVPQSTPTQSRYIKTGLLDITAIVTKNRFNMEKKLHKHPEKLTRKIMELNTKNGWKDTTNKIKENIKRTTQETNTGEINSSQLKNFFKKKIENTCEGTTKTQYLLKKTPNGKLENDPNT